MYPTRSPASSALLDQAQAATRHAGRILAAFYQLEGGTISHGDVDGQAVLNRLAERILTGRITNCPHITSVQPVYWCAWAPGRLRCGRCVDAANRRIRGTVDDRRCDCCRRVVPRIRPITVQLPALVLDNPPTALPPILARYGLCAGCSEEGRAA